MIAGHDEVSDVYGPRVYFNVLYYGNTNSPTQAVTVFKLKLCSDFPLCHLLARLPDGGSPAILTYGDLVLDPSRTPSYYGMKTGRSNVVTLQYREVRPEERIRTEGAIDAQYEKLISPRSDGVDQSMSSTTRDVGLHNQQFASPSSDLVWELVALRNEVATMTRERNALYQRLAQSQVMQSGPNEPLSTSRWGQDVAPYNVQCIARTQNRQKVQLHPKASGHGNRSNHVTPPPPMESHRPVGYIRHILHDVEPSLIEVIQDVPETASCLPHSIEQRKPDLLQGIDYNRTDSQRPVPHSVFDRGDPANADYSDPPYRESYAMLLEAHRHIVALQRERDRLRRRVRVHEGKRKGRHSRDPSRREDWDPKQTNNSRTTPQDIVQPSYPVSSAKRTWAGVAAANVFLGPLRSGSTSKRAVKTSSTEMNHSIQTNREGWNEKTHTSQPGDTKMRGMASVARFISHLKHGIDKKRAGAIENDRDHKYNRSQRQDPGYEVQNAAREQDGTDEIYESTLTRERDDRDESEVHASEGSEDQDEETGEEAGEYIGGEGPDEEEEEEEEALEFHERIPSKRHGMAAHSSIRDPESTLGGQPSSMKAAKSILRR